MAAALTALRRNEDEYDWPEIRPAAPELIGRVHEERLVRGIAEFAATGGGWVDPDTFVVPASYEAALLAAGGTLQAVDDVLAGRQDNAFVVVRPPGHHAMRGRSMGFCLFNSVAVAARWALDEGKARRVAILDIDVHHGNGTQEIFWDAPEVLYYSTHQFPFYPGTGRLQEIGTDDGQGTTVNVPLMGGCGDETYLEVTERVLVPSLRRFAPDLVMVSLGFDAHWADPLANMQLSNAGYASILGRIRDLAAELCGGRLVLLLEGGYDLRVIGEGAALAGTVLTGRARLADALGPAPSAREPAEAAAVIAQACAIHGLPTAS
jgi:acetoin utilization deacetylase AcuC-like enzyme